MYYNAVIAALQYYLDKSHCCFRIALVGTYLLLLACFRVIIYHSLIDVAHICSR